MKRLTNTLLFLLLLGLFAQGEDGDGYADFDWFEYTIE